MNEVIHERSPNINCSSIIPRPYGVALSAVGKSADINRMLYAVTI